MTVLKSLIGPVMGSYLLGQGRKRLAQVDGLIELPGMGASVEVLRDRWGVPHIYAGNLEDLFFVQGFVHGQDRFWQMELHRRLATGRMSELFGSEFLEIDRAARTVGFSRLAKSDLENLTESARLVLSAYTRGVNAYLECEEEHLPIELLLIHHKPQAWTEIDSIAFLRLVLWELSYGWYGEITRARVGEIVGSREAHAMDVPYPAGSPCTLPEGIEVRMARAPRGGLFQEAGNPFIKRGMGSNAWTLAGERTVTGKPFLCNDMHMPMMAPTIWYENHLSSGDFHVTGVSIPGIPLIVGGHNDSIAWGMTVAFTDCEDLFVEKFDPENPRRYWYRDEWQEAGLISETILVKGSKEPHVEQVMVTHHGPVVSDVIDTGAERMALQSMVLQPGDMFDALFKLNAAQNWDEFKNSICKVKIAALNAVYADVHGNFGYWTTGTVPIRAKGDGLTPAPGYTGEYEWVGEVPFQDMPHALNPEKGWIVSANNRIIPEDYPYYLGSIWVNGYRARRLAEMIQSKPKLSPEDFSAMQMDVTSIPGMEFVQKLDGFESQDPDVKLALEQLRAWDGQLTPTTTGGTLYEVIANVLMEDLLRPKLGEELTLQVLGLGFDPLFYPASEYIGHASSRLLRLLDEQESWWFEDAGGRDAMLEQSIRKAMNWLRKRLGPDVKDWQWGKIHRLGYNHAMCAMGPLGSAFSRGPFPIGGDVDTPMQMAFSPADPYDSNMSTPSMRLIMDAGDWSRSLSLTPMGQSGQLGSTHYDDQIPLYLEGKYHPMLWSRQQVEAELEARLILTKP